MRLDKYLVGQYKNLSRVEIQKLIKMGKVLVNGEVCKRSYNVRKNDEIVVHEVKAGKEIVESEEIALDILAEEKDYLVVNKPAGMVVHPSDSGHLSGTVVNALIDRIEDGVGEDFRPGIVHRLDKDTSGVLLVARTKEGYEHFVSEFKARRVKKTYLALVRGHLDYSEGRIDSPIKRSDTQRKKMAVSMGGKVALTNYKVVKEFEIKKGVYVSLLEVGIETGRTHQIRVHLKAIGYPVVGDSAYGLVSFNKVFRERFALSRQFLHAWKLEVADLEGKVQKIKAPLSDDLEDVVEMLKEL